MVRDAEQFVGELALHDILILLDEPLEPQSAESAGVRAGRPPVRPVNAARLPYEILGLRFCLPGSVLTQGALVEPQFFVDCEIVSPERAASNSSNYALLKSSRLLVL
jgi:hypothetical protein